MTESQPFSLCKPCLTMPLQAFKSPDLFRRFFIKQLGQLLQHEEIGVFILVLANALSREQTLHALSSSLERKFAQLRKAVSTASASDLSRIPKDDLEVFLALQHLDIDALTPSRTRQAGRWQLQYHPLRGLRPARNSAKSISCIKQPFDASAFHFNKPFLRKETLWHGEIAQTDVRLMFNKFPFADFHGLIVIDGDSCHPQFLQQNDCIIAQKVYQEISQHTGMGMAYNSLGAYASVNHQHWQSFLSEQPYTVENQVWQHNGGSTEYPLQVKTFSGLARAWPEINHLQQTDQAFNLFLRNSRVWLIKRQRQGEYQHAAWTNGFGWSETAGTVTTARQEEFLSLSQDDLEREYFKLKVLSASS